MGVQTAAGKVSKWAICPTLDIYCDAMQFDSEDEAIAWVQANGHGDWLEEPLPVIFKADCIGPAFSGPLLREWRREEDLMPFIPGGITVEEMVESGRQELRGISEWPTCCLAEDWGFESLEKSAWLREGHDFGSRHPLSAKAVVFRAISDFDDVIRNSFGGVPTSLIASFWQSWQLYRHIHRLCKELEKSKVTRVLQATESDWNDAKWDIGRLVNTYSRQFGIPEKSQAVPATPPTVATSDHGGAGWQTIEVSFLSDERVQISNGEKTETCNYNEFGFADGRTGKPNLAWVTLRAMAEEGGIIRNAAKAGADWPKIEKRIQEIRNVLQKHFSIAADPVPFVKGIGYQACFKIGCSPSFHM